MRDESGSGPSFIVDDALSLVCRALIKCPTATDTSMRSPLQFGDRNGLERFIGGPPAGSNCMHCMRIPIAQYAVLAYLSTALPLKWRAIARRHIIAIKAGSAVPANRGAKKHATLCFSSGDGTEPVSVPASGFVSGCTLTLLSAGGATASQAPQIRVPAIRHAPDCLRIKDEFACARRRTNKQHTKV
eukprot:6175385-Pleurochrysis_carterae.AAC.4